MFTQESIFSFGKLLSFIIFFIPMELAVISTTNGLTKINKYERFVFYLLKSALEGWMYTDWLSTCVL